MPNTNEYHDTTDFPATKALQINSCGMQNHTQFDFRVLRTNGRSDYHFLYIKSGFVDVLINNQYVHVGKGECVIYFPKEKQEYTFHAADCPITYYVHFTGMGAFESMAYFGKRNSILIDLENKSIFEEIFYQLIRVHNQKGPIYLLEENSLLMRLITILASQYNSEHSKQIRNDISEVAEYIYEHYQEDIDFHKYADSLLLSYSHFIHLFTEANGISPHKFLLNIRIDNAKTCLTHTSLTIKEITYHVGFSDPLYFSRLFRKYTGYSPSEYRKHFSALY